VAFHILHALAIGLPACLAIPGVNFTDILPSLSYDILTNELLVANLMQ